MHKKLKMLFLGSILFSLSSAQAGNQFIYVGAEPVYSITNFDWTNTPAGGQEQAIIHSSTNTTNAGIFAGYGILTDKVYLGLEGSTQFGKREATSQTQAFNTQAPLNNKATMSDVYIVDFRPGYLLGEKNSLLYGILGMNSANFNANQTDADGVVEQNSGSIRRTGFRLGVGYNLGLSHYLMARAEYAYTKFSKFDFLDIDQMNPSSNEISLGLAFVIHI